VNLLPSLTLSNTKRGSFRCPPFITKGGKATAEAVHKRKRKVDGAITSTNQLISTRSRMLDGSLALLGAAALFGWLTYALPQLLLKLRSPQDLKKKYNATWALVTGGSSGIGRAVVEKLAAQGLNIVVVAFPDKVLDEAVSEYKGKFPAVEFRKVGSNFAERGFMKNVIDSTNDINVSVVINNAGYIKTGFFTCGEFKPQLMNHDVNATAAVEITHHFIQKMQQKKLRGCVTFTSSPAGFMPCPFSVMYGATKAYLTTFAQSLAPEIYADGIDVSVIHPSPVASRFYDGAHQIDALVFFKSTATGPEVVADLLLACVGRAVTIDQGYYPFCVKTLLKFIDVNFLAGIITLTASQMKDYKEMKNDPKKKE